VHAHPEGEAAGEGLHVQGWGHTQALTQLERRQYRSSGMILLGYGRPEHRREALTGSVEEGARVSLHHLLGHPDHRLQQAI
jgi:hypothetical protein